MPNRLATAFDAPTFLARLEGDKTTLEYPANQSIFSQGDAADAIFLLESGRVKMTAISARGREADLGVVEQGSFFGEGCLAGQPIRVSSARAVEPVRLLRVGKTAVATLIQREPKFAEAFIAHLLLRNVRIEEDLLDQFFNSSEKRLARVLLRLAHFDQASNVDVVSSEVTQIVPKVSQETLASMVGTTRSRVSYFMNRFRKLGFVQYNGDLYVCRSLLAMLLRD